MPVSRSEGGFNPASKFPHRSHQKASFPQSLFRISKHDHPFLEPKQFHHWSTESLTGWIAVTTSRTPTAARAWPYIFSCS